MDKLKSEDWKIKEIENLKILLTNMQHRWKEAEVRNKTHETTIMNLNLHLAQQREKSKSKSIEEMTSSI